eukprot:TRINITY_DN13816_c0_g1_i3.p1 TRINITY_DN13816_c0_g1~~TRINITY_DN13816_c0_g1_i3.p1  ORF type:complete len:335 (+),score=78.40 TRINITY_DN13816_c0_g1_i3:89-1093(+)
MIRRPPRSTHCISSAASDVYKRQTIITYRNQLFAFGSNSHGQIGNNSYQNQLLPLNITENITDPPPKEQSVFDHFHINNIINSIRDAYNSIEEDSDSDSKQKAQQREKASITKPTENKIEEEEKEVILAVSCGYYYTMVQTNKSLYAFGCNSMGQLGLGEKMLDNQQLPIQINGSFQKGSIFKQVRCGNEHTLVLTNKGVFTFGYNNYGQLGNNSQIHSYVPVNITQYFGNEEIVGIHCGRSYSLVQTKNNIYTFGFNTEGELGNGTSLLKLTPTKITKQFAGNKIKQIECLGYHTLVETNQGLYCFGSNQFGGLGNGNNKNQQNPILLNEFYK